MTISLLADITVRVVTRITLPEGETVEQFKRRFADIYLHGAGKDGHLNKVDLGGGVEIHVGSVTIEN